MPQSIAPTVTIRAAKSTLLKGEQTRVSFSLSEVVNNFDWRDITASGGTLTKITPVGNSKTEYTAVYTATETGTSRIEVRPGTFSNLSGKQNIQSSVLDIVQHGKPDAKPGAVANLARSGHDDAIVSEQSADFGNVQNVNVRENIVFSEVAEKNSYAPNVSVKIDKSLVERQAAKLTFTFSEKVYHFTKDDISSSGNGWVNKNTFQEVPGSGGKQYTVMLYGSSLPDNASSGAVKLYIGQGAYYTSSKRYNQAQSFSFKVNDDASPSLQIKKNQVNGKTVIVFDFSEEVNNFTLDDITVTSNKGYRLNKALALGELQQSAKDKTVYTAELLTKETVTIGVNPKGVYDSAYQGMKDAPALKVTAAQPGSILIEGRPRATALLRAKITDNNGFVDNNKDGLPDNATYQWFANGVKIKGATRSTYTLTENEVGKNVTVEANYVDRDGFREKVVSGKTHVIQSTERFYFHDIKEMQNTSWLKTGHKIKVEDNDPDDDNDNLFLNYVVVDALHVKNLKNPDSNLAIALKNGKYAKLELDDKDLPAANNPHAVDKMLEIAKSYVDAKKELVWSSTGKIPLYGQKPEYVPAPDGPAVGGKFTYNKGYKAYGISCSSFVNMVLGGWKYEKSGYKTQDGKNDSSGAPDWDVDFKNFSKTDNPFGADQLLKWFYKGGQTAKFNGDRKVPNFAPGDILFFSNTTDRLGTDKSHPFMNVTHTGIYLGKDAQGNHKIMHSAWQGHYHDGGGVVERTITDWDRLTFIARPNLNGNSAINPPSGNSSSPRILNELELQSDDVTASALAENDIGDENMLSDMDFVKNTIEDVSIADKNGNADVTVDSENAYTMDNTAPADYTLQAEYSVLIDDNLWSDANIPSTATHDVISADGFVNNFIFSSAEIDGINIELPKNPTMNTVEQNNSVVMQDLLLGEVENAWVGMVYGDRVADTLLASNGSLNAYSDDKYMISSSPWEPEVFDKIIL